MSVSIERFLIVNLFLDAVLFSIVSRSCGFFSLKRILIASIISSGYSVLAFLSPNRWKSPLLQLTLLILISLFLSGSYRLEIWSGTALLLAAGTILTGSIQEMMPDDLPATLAGLLIGLSVTSLLFSVRKKMRSSWITTISIVIKKRSVRLRALIDTGNRLHEPISGLPVIIVEEKLIETMLPETGYRHVAYGALGGNGTLRCFRPDEIWIAEGKHRKRAPNAWIGISEVALPCATDALAPSEFANIQ